jgi:hypothetical protein
LIVFYNGSHLQIHPSTITSRARPVTAVQLNGSFEEVFSTSGNPMAPSCGYMANVRPLSVYHTTSSDYPDHFSIVQRDLARVFSGSSSLPWSPLGNLRRRLSSSIIQDVLAMREAGMASVAYFYFDFRDIDKQKLQNLLPSFLIQLSAQSNSCCDVLFRLYSAHNRGVQKPSDHAMVKCLKEMLALEAQGPTYIILDALDECSKYLWYSISARRGP